MYWFIYKHIVSLEENLPCTLPIDLVIIPSSINYYPAYKNVNYRSPDYKTFAEMIGAAHELALLTKRNPIFDFYNDGDYMEEGRKHYEAYRRLKDFDVNVHL